MFRHTVKLTIPLQQDFHADEPNRKWVSDTTYIWTQEGWLFLAVVLDLFSRRVVGWSMAAVQGVTLVTNALDMALARRRPRRDEWFTLTVAVPIRVKAISRFCTHGKFLS